MIYNIEKKYTYFIDYSPKFLNKISFNSLILFFESCYSSYWIKLCKIETKLKNPFSL